MALPIHGDRNRGGESKGSSGRALVLIGRPFGDDALLAAAAAWLDAHPAPVAALPVSLAVPGGSAEGKSLSEGEAWCAGLSLGTRLVGRLLCGTGWARAWGVIGGGAGLLGGAVSSAYDRQRLEGYR